MLQFLAPALIAAAGAGINMYAQNQANQRQQAAIRQKFLNEQTANKEKNAAILEGVNQYQSDNRVQQYQQAQTDNVDRLMSVLNNTSDELQTVPESTQGNTGQDYDLARAQAASTSKNRAYQLAKLLGRTDGAGELMRREADVMAKAENKAQLIGNYANGQSLLDNIKVNNAGQVNPWLQFAGNAMSSYGTGQMGKMDKWW